MRERETVVYILVDANWQQRKHSLLHYYGIVLFISIHFKAATSYSVWSWLYAKLRDDIRTSFHRLESRWANNERILDTDGRKLDFLLYGKNKGEIERQWLKHLYPVVRSSSSSRAALERYVLVPERYFYK